MPRISKIIVLGLLFCISFSSVAAALAAEYEPMPELEQRYPSLPIIGSLDDANKLPPEERMGFYVKYFINIVFFIVIGVCIIVLIIGGIAYVAPPILDKIISITAAKTMIKNAFLGLFILATSYMILYAINPNLLFLSLDVPDLSTPIRFAQPPYDANEVVYGRVLVPSTLKRIIEGLGEKVYLDDQGRYYEEINEKNCLTDGYGNFLDLDGDYLRGDDIRCVEPLLAANRPKNRFLAVLIDRVSAAFIPNTGPITKYKPGTKDNFVYRAEIPFFDTYNTLDEAILEIDGEGKPGDADYYPGLKELLSNCNCGISMFHTKWQGLDTYCVGGLDPNSYEAQNAVDYCATQSKDCGKIKDDGGAGAYICDLHEVVVATTTVKVAGGAEAKAIKLVLVDVSDDPSIKDWKYLPNDWKALDWKPDVGWEPKETEDNLVRVDPLFELVPLNTEADHIKPERLIKYRVIQLEDILETLESQKRMFFPKQAGFLADALSINKMKFLVSNIRDGIFNADFEEEKEELEAAGYKVSVEDMQETGRATEQGTVKPSLPSADSSRGLLARLMDFFNPQARALSYKYLGSSAGALYFKVHADKAVAPEEEITHNKFIKRESNRANLFSVLSGLTLETIEQFFNGCLTTAFGKANYHLDKEELETVIEQAGREGVLERFEKEFESRLDEINAQPAMVAGMSEAVNIDVIKRMIIEQCVESSSCVAGDVDEPEEINNLMQMAEQGSCSALTTCCRCAENLLKNKMPPHFVSETILKVLNTGIRDYFDSISELLNTKMRNIFFEEGGEINDFLDEEMIEVYNKILNSAFDKSLAEHIPGLENLLQAQMKDVLPDVVTRQLTKVDRFLKCSISGCCTPAADESQCRQEVFKEGDDGKKYCCDPTADPIDVNDPTVCREAINKYKCQNQKFRVVGGIKQCCQDGMAQWVKAHSSDYLKEKTKDYITDPLNELVEGKVCDWGLSTDCANINRCVEGEWPYRVFVPDQAVAPVGRLIYNYDDLFNVPELKYFDEGLLSTIAALADSDFSDFSSFIVRGSKSAGYPGDNFTEPLKGKCEKLTPGQINDLSKPDTIIPIFEFLNVADGDVADMISVGFKNADSIVKAAIESALAEGASPDEIEGVIEDTEQTLKDSIDKRVLFIGLAGSKQKQNKVKEKICRGSGHQWHCSRKAYASTIPCCEDGNCGDGYTCQGAINDCEGDPDCEECDVNNLRALGICKKTFAEIDYDYDVTDDCECVDADVLTQDISGAVDTMADIRNTGKNILGGLMRYGSQLLTALIDTLLHTFIEYAKVVIEDRIVAPFKDAFDTVVGFQQGIGKFLEKSVAQVLPEEIADVLQSNIGYVITDVCQQLSRFPDEDAEVTIRLPLPKGVAWEDEANPALFEDVPVSAKTKKTFEQAFCKTSAHLHTTVFGEIVAMGSIGQDLYNLLQRTFEDHLNSLCDMDLSPIKCAAGNPGCQCVTEWLDKSLIAILWPGLKNVEELVKGTPKEFLCGELSFDVKGWDESEKPAVKCEKMKKHELGTLPVVDTDSPIYKAMTKGEQDRYVPWCNFIYSACNNPFSDFMAQPAGKVIEKAARQACVFVKDDAAEVGCDGVCIGTGASGSFPSAAMEMDAGCPENNKNYCRGCNFMLENTVAFSTFYQAVKKMFWLPPYACADCLFHKYPLVIPIDMVGLAETKTKEKEVYKWLLVYFGNNLANEIKAVALKRGFSSAGPGNDWSEIAAAAAGLTSMVFPVTGSETDFLLLLGSWVMNGSPTLRDIITTIPLGAIKGMEPGEPTLMLPQGSNEKKNFLDKTPYQLLKDYACKSIETAYKKKYPSVAFKALAKPNKASIPGVLTTYNIESVDAWTISDRLEVIASFQIQGQPPVDEDLRNSYLFCKMLDLPPAESLGLDLRLKNYIRPKEFIILFDLMYQELKPYERPEELNKVLYYLYDQTPVNVLADIANSLASEPGRDEYRFLLESPEANFSGLVLGETIEVLELAKRNALTNLFNNKGLILSGDAYLSEPLISGDINGEPIWGFLDDQYYLTVIGGVSNRIVKVYDSPGTVEKLLMKFSWMLGTNLGKQVNEGVMKARIIDIICDHPDMQKDGKSLCKWTPTDGIDGWNILSQEFLGKTPIQLIVKYLTKPIGPPALTDPNMSAMDMLSQNSVLGERYLDTFVRWLPFGAEEKFFKAGNAANKVKGWVDYGVNTGVSTIQQGLETALLEYPREAASALVKLLGEKMGIKAGEQIAGKCYSIKPTDICQDGYVRRTNGSNVECCSLAGKYVCHDVCRVPRPLEQCNLIKGEVEVWDGPDRLCCFQKDDVNCRKCRRVNADLTACRETDDETTNETRAIVKTDSGKFTVCCHDEPEVIADSGISKCCISVADCVAGKFADHMEAMADMLAEGFLPVKLKP